MSVYNNVSESSGGTSTKEFQKLLNYVRRSIFGNANMLLFFQSMGHLKQESINELRNHLAYLSAKILNFSRSLSKD